MAAFTALSSWANGLQDLAAANEIVLAFQERRKALGQAEYEWGTPAQTSLASDDSAQDKTLWNVIQAWCETYATSWRDHTITVDGATASEAWSDSDTNLAQFTLSSWRTEAGIPSGFRRATTYPTNWTDYEDENYMYGAIQEGDIVGPWVYEDLQNALGAMRETSIYLSVSTVSREVKSAFNDSEVSYADAHAGITWPASWGAASSADGKYMYFVRTEAREFEDGGTTNYRASCYRARGSRSISGIPTGISHIGEWYLFLRPATKSGTYSFVQKYHDMDGYGDNGTFALFEEFGASTDSSHTYEPPNDGKPILPPAAGDLDSYGVMAGRAATSATNYAAVYFVAKWQFTNQ